MDKELFYEYDEGKGIGDLLFVNTNKVNYYRFYRKRHEWDDCYMIEFSIDSDEYFMYWGGYDDHINRNMVCSFDILLPSDPKGDGGKSSSNHYLHTICHKYWNLSNVTFILASHANISFQVSTKNQNVPNVKEQQKSGTLLVLNVERRCYTNATMLAIIIQHSDFAK